MFRKLHHYDYSGKIHKSRHDEAEKKWDYKLQIIVCGSRAKSVLQAMNLKGLEITDDKDVYAINFLMSGTTKMWTDTIVDSDVKYSEKRKENKAKNYKKFDHQDVVGSTTRSSALTVSGYERTEVNYKSGDQILIVNASGDYLESKRIKREMAKKVGKAENVFYLCANLPSNVNSHGDHSWTISEAFNDVDVGGNMPVLCMCHDADYAELFAINVEEKINKIASDFEASITKNAEKKIQEELVKDIEDQLHQQADEYFASPFYKR